MLKRFVIFVFLTAFIVIGCSSFSIHTDYDQSADFSGYDTFGWVKHKKVRMDRKGLMNAKIRSAVKAELESKGMRFVDRAPDLLVNYHFGVRDKIDVDVYGYGYRPGWKRRVVRHYKEGTLVLDIVDFSKKHLIWRGSASGIVGPPADAQAKMAEAVAGILKEYPPSQ
jgi:hypothetical protein